MRQHWIIHALPNSFCEFGSNQMILSITNKENKENKKNPNNTTKIEGRRARSTVGRYSVSQPEVEIWVMLPSKKEGKRGEKSVSIRISIHTLKPIIM